VPNQWWIGELLVKDASPLLVVPGLLSLDMEVGESRNMMQRMQNGTRSGGRLSLYSSGLTAAAILQQERNVQEARLLLLHALLHQHLKRTEMGRPIEAHVDLREALDALRDYSRRMTEFLRSHSSDMKSLKKQFQQKPRRFVDLVRRLKAAFS